MSDKTNIPLSGVWAGNQYIAYDPLIDVVVYRRWNMTGTESAHTKFNLSYTQSTGLWSQGPGIETPFFLNSVDSFSTATTEVADAETIYGYTSDGQLYFWFSSPWYEPPATGTEGDDVSAKAQLTPTGGQILTSHVYLAYNTVTQDPTSDFTNDVVTYRQYSVSGYSSHSRYNFTYTQSTKIWSHSSGDPSDDYFPSSLNSVDSHLTATATVYNPETLFGYTDTGGLYFKFVNPWYEPPPPPPPPPPPIVVPRSARRGNLNFW